MADFYRIVEWGTYQHYRDRSPPWIKLHANTLTSRTWVSLSNDGRALAIACMLEAAATDNKIPADPQYMRRRAYFDEAPDFAPLVAVGFIALVGDNNDLAKSTQADASATLANGTERSSESEGETEQSKEEKKDNSTSRKALSAEQRGTRLPDDWKPTAEDRAFAIDLGLDPDVTADEFRDYWTALPGARGRKLNWSKTFKNRCRELGKKPRLNGAVKGETFEQKRQRENLAVIHAYEATKHDGH